MRSVRSFTTIHPFPTLCWLGVRFPVVLLSHGPSLHHLRRQCLHRLCSAASQVSGRKWRAFALATVRRSVGSGTGADCPAGSAYPVAPRFIGVSPSPVIIPAIDDLRLLRMKFQPALFQTRGYGRPDLLCLYFCSAMHDDIIGKPLKRVLRILRRHPPIKSIVQKQIR
jgi:hypothetical protein